MAVADRYGWHRDELYYLASSRHLSLGYVDYPPVTPLLARLDQALFPGSLPGLRLLSVLAGAAVIVIAALIARERGGNRLAQALTGLAVLISPEFIGTNILFQTVSFDQVVWAVACLLFVRLLRGANPREWLWLGLVFGIGLETKYTVIGLGVAMLVGLLVTRQRRLLASRWPWHGFGLAVLLLLPNIAWQVGHNWDSVAYTLQHRGNTDGPILYWVQQVLLVGPQLRDGPGQQLRRGGGARPLRSRAATGRLRAPYLLLLGAGADESIDGHRGRLRALLSRSILR